MTFAEYQARVAEVPVSLRNNRDRINLPVMGLQEEAGKIGSLMGKAFSSGKPAITPEEREDLQARLSETLWYVALLCNETGIPMQDTAEKSVALVQARAKELDQDRR